MKFLYEFRCPDGHLTEEFIDSEVREVPCEVCDKIAHRAISAGSYIKVDGFRADINSEKWAKTRLANAKRHRENNDL